MLGGHLESVAHLVVTRLVGIQIVKERLLRVLLDVVHTALLLVSSQALSYVA